ncbi:hypothetical protein M8680_25500, partial [Escherichia coli]|nr:hypothetical protein [Escherichia coli]
MLYAIVISTI